jgi:hypothetical protein
LFRATDEREVARECLDRARHAIPARAAQLDEILRRGKSDQEVSVVLKDTPEFGRIHPRRNRQHYRERAIDVRHEAIGIGHDPLAPGIAPRRGIDCWNRDIDSMGIEAGLGGEISKVETVTAAGIENNVAWGCGDGLCNRLRQRTGHAAIVQPPPPCDRNRRVARLL